MNTILSIYNIARAYSSQVPNCTTPFIHSTLQNAMVFFTDTYIQGVRNNTIKVSGPYGFDYVNVLLPVYLSEILILLMDNPTSNETMYKYDIRFIEITSASLEEYIHYCMSQEVFTICLDPDQNEITNSAYDTICFHTKPYYRIYVTLLNYLSGLLSLKDYDPSLVYANFTSLFDPKTYATTHPSIKQTFTGFKPDGSFFSAFALPDNSYELCAVLSSYGLLATFLKLNKMDSNKPIFDLAGMLYDGVYTTVINGTIMGSLLGISLASDWEGLGGNYNAKELFHSTLRAFVLISADDCRLNTNCSALMRTIKNAVLFYPTTTPFTTEIALYADLIVDYQVGYFIKNYVTKYSWEIPITTRSMKIFNYANRFVYNGPEFKYTLSMHSARSASYSCNVSSNKLGYYLSSGYEQVFNNVTIPLYSAYWQTISFDRLQGTASLPLISTMYCTGQQNSLSTLNPATFVGGFVVNDSVALIGYNFIPPTTDYSFYKTYLISEYSVIEHMGRIVGSDKLIATLLNYPYDTSVGSPLLFIDGTQQSFINIYTSVQSVFFAHQTGPGFYMLTGILLDAVTHLSIEKHFSSGSFSVNGGFNKTNVTNTYVRVCRMFHPLPNPPSIDSYGDMPYTYFPAISVSDPLKAVNNLLKGSFVVYSSDFKNTNLTITHTINSITTKASLAQYIVLQTLAMAFYNASKHYPTVLSAPGKFVVFDLNISGLNPSDLKNLSTIKNVPYTAPVYSVGSAQFVNTTVTNSEVVSFLHVKAETPCLLLFRKTTVYNKTDGPLMAVATRTLISADVSDPTLLLDELVFTLIIPRSNYTIQISKSPQIRYTIVNDSTHNSFALKFNVPTKGLDGAAASFSINFTNLSPNPVPPPKSIRNVIYIIISVCVCTLALVLLIAILVVVQRRKKQKEQNHEVLLNSVHFSRRIIEGVIILDTKDDPEPNHFDIVAFEKEEEELRKLNSQKQKDTVSGAIGLSGLSPHIPHQFSNLRYATPPDSVLMPQRQSSTRQLVPLNASVTEHAPAVRPSSSYGALRAPSHLAHVSIQNPFDDDSPLTLNDASAKKSLCTSWNRGQMPRDSPATILHSLLHDSASSVTTHTLEESGANDGSMQFNVHSIADDLFERADK